MHKGKGLGAWTREFIAGKESEDSPAVTRKVGRTSTKTAKAASPISPAAPHRTLTL